MNGKELQIFNSTLGRRLKELREKAKVTQEHMALEANCTKNYISAIERGLHKLTVPMLVEYCRVLRLSPNEILDISDKNKNVELIESLSAEELAKVKSIIEIIRS